MRGKGRMFAALLVFVATMASAQPAHADHYFGEPCASGQELTIFGFTAWDLSIVYRMVSTNSFGEHEYYMESYFRHEGEGWGTFVVAAVRNVVSWERVADVQVTGPDGSHFVWIECADEDPDPEFYGPYLKEPYSD